MYDAAKSLWTCSNFVKGHCALYGELLYRESRVNCAAEFLEGEISC